MPHSDDLLDDVGPLGQALYLNQLAYRVLSSFAGMLTAQDNDDLPTDGGPIKALAALTLACGNLDAMCIELQILPPEAAAPA